MSNRHYVPESTTTIEYPRSKRKVVLDHTGKVISDTNRTGESESSKSEHKNSLSQQQEEQSS
jgi:hypothetical protein